MRRSNCASALQYMSELTWILFLRVLEEQEAIERDEAEALGPPYSPSLVSPYRWQDWAAPSPDKSGTPTTDDSKCGIVLDEGLLYRTNEESFVKTERAQIEDKLARDALGKAQTIDDAIYDLKAVNPREKKVVDIRIPAQLLQAIEEKGREVDAALEKLKTLL